MQKTFDLNTIFAKIPKIIIIAIIVYILDVWLLTILSASIAEPSTITYYIFHPISTSLRYLLGFFYPDLVHNQSVFNTWKLINGGLILIGIGIFIYSSSNKITNRPVFKSDLLGSADWLKRNEIQPVFATKHSPGILFGLHQKKPIVLPPLADGNRNVAIWGPPGTRKSRAYIRNNLFQAVKTGWSVVVTDPKGELTRDFRKFFEKQGYAVKVFNLVNMAYSDRWNPLSEIKTDIDAQIFCEVVMANTTAPNKKGDQFWDRAETNLLKALVLYVIYEFPEKDRNMGSVCQIISSGSRDYIKALFDALPNNHTAKIPFNAYIEASDQVQSGVILGLATRLQVFQTDIVRSLTETTDINIDLPGEKKCAYFCILSDMDRTFDFLASLYFSFLFISLTKSADRNDGELKIPVNFLLDEFCNIGYIPDFDKKLSTMRGRGIACSVVFQSLPQLMEFYPNKKWETIIANCDSWFILGAKDNTSAEYISKHLGEGTIETNSISKTLDKPLSLGKNTTRLEKRKLMNIDEIVRMPRNLAILSAFGLKPLMLEKLDYTKHPMSNLLEPASVSSYRPEWSSKYIKDPVDEIIDEIINESETIEFEEEEPGIYVPKTDEFWS